MPRRLLLIVGGFLIATAFSCAVRAEFVIKKVTAQQSVEGLQVSAEVDLSLSNEAQTAVENGVPLVVTTEFVVLQPGPLWDKTLFTRKLHSRLRYHALSDRYIVERIEQATDIESFRSVDNALRQLGKIKDIKLAINTIPANSMLAVRSNLDINSLPAPLRPMALFSSDWRLSSEWTQWKIDR